MRRFIARGDIVVVKPNIGWDRAPEQAANTNPAVVAEVVRLCLDAGARRVIVTDMSCNDPRVCFERSGIAAAAKAAGAEVILPDERRFKQVNLGGEVLTDVAGARAVSERRQGHQPADRQAPQPDRRARSA